MGEPIGAVLPKPSRAPVTLCSWLEEVLPHTPFCMGGIPCPCPSPCPATSEICPPASVVYTSPSPAVVRLGTEAREGLVVFSEPHDSGPTPLPTAISAVTQLGAVTREGLEVDWARASEGGRGPELAKQPCCSPWNALSEPRVWGGEGGIALIRRPGWLP